MTDSVVYFIEGTPIGTAYPEITADIRAEYFAAQPSSSGPNYRSQFMRIAFNCVTTTFKIESGISYTGNGFGGEARFDSSHVDDPAAMPPRSGIWMVASQACPMARGEPAPGFNPPPKFP